MSCRPNVPKWLKTQTCILKQCDGAIRVILPIVREPEVCNTHTDRGVAVCVSEDVHQCERCSVSTCAGLIKADQLQRCSNFLQERVKWVTAATRSLKLKQWHRFDLSLHGHGLISLLSSSNIALIPLIHSSNTFDYLTPGGNLHEAPAAPSHDPWSLTAEIHTDAESRSLSATRAGWSSWIILYQICEKCAWYQLLVTCWL